MSLFVSWVLFPLLLALLALGCGLLLEIVADVRLPGALVVPAGLAVIFVVTHFATATDRTAELAVPAVLALSAAGLLLSPPWQLGRVDRWAVAVAVGVFTFFALPVVLLGETTFTGYIKLDDTATWLAITDHVMEQGREVSGLAPSSFEATVDINLSGGYPWGAFPPLGLGHELLGTDSAWLFQPYLALLASMLALCLYLVGEQLVASRGLRALAAVVASQAALLFGYFLWGGIKEIAAAWIIALLAAVVPPMLRQPTSIRALLPLAVGCAALLGILSFGGIAWLGPLLLAIAVLFYVRLGPKGALKMAAAFAALTALLSLPSLLTADDWLGPAGGTLTNETDLGNLFSPLNRLQVFGIWPVADFRFDPESLDLTYVLIAVAALASVVGGVIAWQRRSWIYMVYLGSVLIGGFAIHELASPWVGAKALATASPTLVFAALLGAFAIFERGRRIEGALAAIAVIGGVLWSNALAYDGVTIAPRDRFAELEKIGEKISGQGPTLMTDYEPYGARHFLRKADAEGASELRRRTIPLRTGMPLGKIQFADIDEFDLNAILTYRTLVLRRSPIASRPPSTYALVRVDRYYETWQRPEGASGLIAEHLSLGSNSDPSAVPTCADVLRLARVAGSLGKLAAVKVESPILVPLTRTTYPPSWKPVDGDPNQLLPTGAGTLETTVSVPINARYGIWLGGAFRRRLELSVDGRRLAGPRHELSHTGQYVPLASEQLERGEHRIALRYDEKDLRPGSGGDPFPFGPLALSRSTADRSVTFLPPENARSLCGQRLDWVEALRS